jgi:hypothetical protein
MQKLPAVVALAVAAGLGACEKQLTVTNPNEGETKRVLGTPNDAEALISTYYKRWFTGVYGSLYNLEGMANNFSMMNYSSLGNNCQNSHIPFYNAANDNTPGNGCNLEQVRLYAYMGEVNRVAMSLISQMNGGLTLGSPARDARAKSWAWFLNGLALGYVALMHDSGAVVTPEMSAEDPGPLVGYAALADSAAASFQRAIDEATKPVTGQLGFPIPDAWMPSPTAWTAAEFVKLVRSYRARIMANVARTPAERAARNWTAIMADAAAGITADHQIVTNTVTGPVPPEWRRYYSTYGLWHQMSPFYIGMADVSGSYATWIATPLGARGAGNNAFFMVTPDLRFPQGATRAAQQADFAITSCQGAGQTCKRYFVNRMGNDQFAGDGFGLSNYDHVRFHSWAIAGDAGQARNGKTIMMTYAEIDLLGAEGMYRAGDYAGAAAIVNKTRTRNGLPAITAFDASTPVPGGVDCVPKVPVGPNYNTIACGTLWDALKYEKRIETAYTTYVPWYLDGRGWGELPQTTPLFWPVPYQDLQARGYAAAAIYGTGVGTGNAPNSAAAKSVYGW